MWVSIDWLQEFIPIEDVDENLFLKLGLEIEEIDDPKQRLKDLRTGHVIECLPHPHSNKLKLCIVDVGQGITKQIICGAENVRAGINVIICFPGFVVPKSGLKIEIAQKSGAESHGMICSFSELNLTDILSKSHDIAVLSNDVRPGQEIEHFLPKWQMSKAFHLSCLPNSGRLLGISKLAKEISRLLKLPYKMATLANSDSADSKSDLVYSKKSDNQLVSYIDEEICACVFLSKLQGLSPTLLKIPLSEKYVGRLLRSNEATNLSPGSKIAGIVSAVNYASLHYGQPFHIYDLSTINGKLSIKNGTREAWKALDGNQYNFENVATVSDEKDVLCLAGVIGGDSSKVCDTTTDILIEVACFKPEKICETVAKTGIRSPASSLFSHGINFAESAFISRDVTYFLYQMLGNHSLKPEFSSHLPSGRSYQDLWTGREIELDVAQSILDCDPKEAEKLAILSGYGVFYRPIEKNNAPFSQTILVRCPSAFTNVISPCEVAEDLYWHKEFVADCSNVFGHTNGGAGINDDHASKISFKRTTSNSLKDKNSSSVLNNLTSFENKLRMIVAAAGFNEIVSMPFEYEKRAELFQTNPIMLKNPINMERPALRASLIPGLFDSYLNFRTHAMDFTPAIKLFEIGTIFSSKHQNFDEKKELGLLFWQSFKFKISSICSAKIEDDGLMFRNHISSIFASFGVKMPDCSYKKDEGAPLCLNNRNSYGIFIGGKKIGYCGSISSKLFDHDNDNFADSKIWGCSIDIQELFSTITSTKAISGVQKPLSVREFSFIVKNDLDIGLFGETILEPFGDTLENWRIVDIFSSETMRQEDQISVTILAEFRENDLKISVEKICSQVFDLATSKFDSVPRTPISLPT